MELETHSRLLSTVSAVSESLKERAAEKTGAQIRKMQAGQVPPSELIRKVEITEDGEAEPLEDKAAFAALDAGLEVDMNTAADLLGKYATKGKRFNTLKFVKDAPKALYAIGFDPMIEMVRAYREIEDALEMHNSGKKKLSTLVHTEFIRTRSTLATNLLKYAYTPAREEAAGIESPELFIVLEGQDGNDVKE